MQRWLAAFNRHRLSQIVLQRLAQISPLKNCRKHLFHGLGGYSANGPCEEVVIIDFRKSLPVTRTQGGPERFVKCSSDLESVRNSLGGAEVTRSQTAWGAEISGFLLLVCGRDTNHHHS